MRTFTVAIEVAAGPDRPGERIDALAGTGRLNSFVPAAMLRRLGVEPTDRRTFIYPDGERMERDIGWPVVRVEGSEQAHPSLVVFGDDDSEPLLGNLTLTLCGLEVDPERDELVPLTAYLPGIRVEAAA